GVDALAGTADLLSCLRAASRSFRLTNQSPIASRISDQVNPQAILAARPLRANTKYSGSHSRRRWLTEPARTASNRIDTTKKTFISIRYNKFLPSITEGFPDDDACFLPPSRSPEKARHASSGHPGTPGSAGIAHCRAADDRARAAVRGKP